MFVGVIIEAAGAKNRLAEGQDFVAGDFLRAGDTHGANDVNAATVFAHEIDGEDDGGLIVVFSFEGGFEFAGQLLAGFVLGWDAAEVRDFDVPRVGDEDWFGFERFPGVVEVFKDAEAELIADGKPMFVVQRIHAVGGSYRGAICCSLRNGGGGAGRCVGGQVRGCLKGIRGRLKQGGHISKLRLGGDCIEKQKAESR